MLNPLIVLSLLGQSAAAPEGMPFVSPVFSDHMVLQRDRENTIWGWTVPGAQVSVSVGGNSGSGIADGSGKWMVHFKPPKVGGPYAVQIDGPQHRTLNDVLVGDVWICTGQSNMEFGIGNGKDAQSEIAAANYPQIRLSMVPKDTQFGPRPWTSAPWYVCTPETVARGGWNGFSAVGFFFGRELNKRLNVPIGLIEDCWGGTPAESWIDREHLTSEGDFSAVLAKIDAAKQDGDAAYGEAMDKWLSVVDPGSKADGNWQSVDLDDSQWAQSPTVASVDGLGLNGFNGVVWMRSTIDLTSELAQSAAVLSLGKIGDLDTAWVNGVQVGATNVWSTERNYAVPAGTLKAGKNVIAVRIVHTGGPGGFLYGPAGLNLSIGSSAKVAIGTTPWRYKLGPNAYIQPGIPQPLENNPYVATALYDGMMAPVAPLALKGAIWYQGESNAGRAYQYRTLLPLMISNWRSSWGEGDFPFLVVQLANWQARAKDPGESDWAELREAQDMTARNGHNVGIATAVDIGDTSDIHPKDKQDVGLRLALAALHMTYGQRLAYSGPTYKSFKIDGSSIRISFDHADRGLQASGGPLMPQGGETVLKGFAIAGADHKFYWADAQIVGDTVVVKSSDVPNPVAVRYGWANNPEVTLYNGAGLPALPFRTDDWPGVTVGRK